MEKFYFEAITTEGKQLSGYIKASSEIEAKQKLKDSKLSILTLEKRSITGIKKGLILFEFEAQNSQKKTVKGTIESTDVYQAYKKLKLNYKFEVKYIIENNKPEEEKKHLRLQPINPAFKEQLDEEVSAEVKALKKSGKLKSDREEEVEKILEFKSERIKFMQHKIDDVLQAIVPLLEANDSYIDPIKKREIEERIDLLSRLKHSNSIDHLKNLTTRLLEELSSDEIFLSGDNLSPEEQAEIQRRREQFMSVNDKFSKVINKGFSDLQESFTHSMESFRETLSSLEIFEKVTKTLCLIFFTLSLIYILFWAIVLGAKSMSMMPIRADFYLHSSILWYISSFAIISTIWIWLLRRPNFDTNKKQYAVIGLGIFIHFVFLVQFPAIFYWTGL